MKKSLAVLTCITLAAATLLSGCSNGQGQSGGATASSPGEPQKVVYWYTSTGDEAKNQEQAISAFNSSQSQYKVEGLSVPDKQKFIVAMASDDSPDVVSLLDSEVVTYEAQGMLENLSPYIEKNNFNIKDFSEMAVKSNTVDNNVYGMPYSVNIIQMYYNKAILKAHGYTEPPKTMEELYDMGVACTQTDAKGNITVLGYPLFPLAAVPLEGVYAFGGRWAADDGTTVTPNNPGVLASMNMNLKYRQKFGMKNVQAFVATANTNRYTPQDDFFAGREVFRFDGLWLTTMITKNKPDLDYGVTYIPGTKANPDAQGSSRLETSSVSISKVSKDKDGAFAFMEYYATKGMKGVLLTTGGLPTYEPLFQDKDILAQKDIGTFLDAMKLNKGVQFPPIKDAAKYKSLINSAYDYVYNGSKTPEKALADLENDCKSLQK